MSWKKELRDYIKKRKATLENKCSDDKEKEIRNDELNNISAKFGIKMK